MKNLILASVLALGAGMLGNVTASAAEAPLVDGVVTHVRYWPALEQYQQDKGFVTVSINGKEFEAVVDDMKLLAQIHPSDTIEIQKQTDYLDWGRQNYVVTKWISEGARGPRSGSITTPFAAL
ncbi:hypothetical protein SAMN05444156_2160 [Verrucomicrobium sp. GAS474]|uniref:hypothetical protein n=1 Tax=Verrucomicrobium sp. GAS474 TaxID=1882831 RepID=UPI00087BA200|nr:hypothetical protein [Verrucomicrobium sp. GAS474]SDU13398.1 hypothetical protein SAMN05444156_2160 [Verrucomicrobium sp. GAS474]